MANKAIIIFILIIFFMCDYSNGICPSLVSTVTTNVICTYNNKVLKNCISPMEGTKALLSCNSFYEEPRILANPIRFCREGSWNAPVPNCYPNLRLANDHFNHFLTSEFSRFKRQLSNTTQSCEILKEPPYTKYRILKKSTAGYQPGDSVPTASVLEISCVEGYNLINQFSQKYSICLNGKWIPLPANCSRSCPSLTSTESTLVSCSYEGIPLDNCSNPVEQTRARLSCTQFYEEVSLTRNPIRVCRNGEWNPSIVKCYPTCGLIITKGISNIVGGDTNEPDYPWHVGVYNTEEKLICSGSIIDRHAIVSAAHCFTDHLGNVHSTENYLIVAGSIHSKYIDPRDEFAQYSKVLAIHIPERFKGGVQFYSFDIAVIILADSFTFSQVVQPICTELNEENQNIHFSINETALITGWNEEYASDNALEKLIVSYVPYNECYIQTPRDFRKYITFDKICGAYLTYEKSAYRINSGGGLSFKSAVNNRYYLIGILIKILPPLAGTRDSYNSRTLTLHTELFQYIKFVADYIQYYKSEQRIESVGKTENRNACRFPNFPLNGKYIFFPQNSTPAPGDYVPLKSMLNLSCDVGYEISSSNATQSVCVNQGEWFPTLGTCKTQLADNETSLSDKSSDFNYFNIIFIVVGVVGFVIALVAIVLLKSKFKKEKELRRELQLAGLDRFQYGDLKRFNPELGIDDQADLLPYNSNYEFSRDKLDLGKQLGSGAFGVVLKAEACGIISTEEKTIVAVKTVKNFIDHVQIKALISELKVMIHIGQHLNVVNLLGACTQNITKGELLVIVEYCRFGSLYNYLLQNRHNYIDQIDSVTGNIDYSFGSKDSELMQAVVNNASTSQKSHARRFSALNRINYASKNCDNNIQSECKPKLNRNFKEIINPLFTKDLISWSFQIARGMEYLASRKVLHGDLAARNILLAENNVVKICDFGLSKRMYRKANYKKNKNSPLPFKWMAIESIRDMVFSTQSDVWSYGIVLWELFSLAQTPYPGMEPDEKLYQKLLDGYKMESPQYAPKEMYKTMCDCWNINPLLRPSFNQLAGAVGLMLEENIRQHYIDLNDLYLVINTRRLNEDQTDNLVTLSPPDTTETPEYLCVQPSYLPIDRENTISDNEENIVDICDM